MVCEWAARSPETKAWLRWVVRRKSNSPITGHWEYIMFRNELYVWTNSFNLATVFDSATASALALIRDCGVVEMKE